ncbi:MAG: aminotransferase class I/II-fold pyridoxal phosphate-dependent enzyme [Oligoflexia bacterium]|nr:aminotransferase class I/II-fold pyridoxal phosphate-dependent enzyme [Oligoflexia bacterium]
MLEKSFEKVPTEKGPSGIDLSHRHHKLPKLSDHFAARKPSAIRLAQIEFMRRLTQNTNEKIEVVNTAIGNVSLPMHPAMQKRLRELGQEGASFADGVIKYSATVGNENACKTFLHIIASSVGTNIEDSNISKLRVQVTDGGSAAMELIILAVGGGAGSGDRPILLIDPAYTNYRAFAERLGRRVVSVSRSLGRDGKFSLPNWAEIETVIKEHGVSAIVVIPYDNPTGQLFSQETMRELARISVKYNLWLISDEAYRELYYLDHSRGNNSIWALTEDEIPGIVGRRVSIESASKVWNACGLRIGAIVTDSQQLHIKAVAENTANLCANVVGQEIFSALLNESHAELRKWYQNQRSYYQVMMQKLSTEIKRLMPGVIISSPDAALYSVIDVRDLVNKDFHAEDFVMYCASKGSVLLNELNIDGQVDGDDGKKFTLLLSPMAEFYGSGSRNRGRTQMRMAYVEPPQKMALVPKLFSRLLADFLQHRLTQ